VADRVGLQIGSGSRRRHGALFRLATAALVLWTDIALSAEGAHAPHHAPSISDLLYPGINFLLFAILIWWAGAAAIRDYLRNRRATIVAALEHAATGKRDAEQAHAEVRAQLARADAEAESLRKDMRAMAEVELERRHKLAAESATRIKADARIAAEQQGRAAQAALREETVRAAVEETLAVLRRQIKAPDQERFVGDFVAEMGRRR
jgi:F-type H+-transporting ATPase subunit b